MIEIMGPPRPERLSQLVKCEREDFPLPITVSGPKDRFAEALDYLEVSSNDSKTVCKSSQFASSSSTKAVSSFNLSFRPLE